MANNNKVKPPISPRPEKPEARVVPVDIISEMKESYIDYAMSVIVARALPDVRDGLKPVHRRILYAMAGLGLAANAKFRKSALVVGEVLGKYHPHGDTSVYEAMVRMAQDFNLLHPLIIGQGNFGSVDGDPPAAMRYTEAKMSPLAAELLRDIEKETVEFVPNYDNSRREPVVLPSAAPNLLINGTVGIAVGMATRVLPHNLREVMEALIYMVDHPEAATEDLLRFVKGPDFPTAGVIYGEKDIHHVAATGRGGILVRGEVEVVEAPNGSFQIIITSIPYQVNKAELIIHVADLVREKKIEGIRDIREESTTLDKMRIVVDLKNGASPQLVVNALYKHTSLSAVLHSNMLALVDSVPKLLPLRQMAEEFIAHRRQIITRRSQFDLARCREREHVLLGLKRAIDILDEVIKTIRRSQDAADAHKNLVAKFKFTAAQTTAILELRLQKLANLEIRKVLDELRQKQMEIKALETLLANQKKISEVVKKEFAEIAEKYGQPRRTKIIKEEAKDFRPEDLVSDNEYVLVVTAGGYVKRTDPAEYRAQRRGGVGVVDIDVKEEDFVAIFLSANAHDDLLFFTNRGKAYPIKMYEVPEGRRATRGKSIMNFLPLAAAEKVTSVLTLPPPAKTQNTSLCLVTRHGAVKKAGLSCFREIRRSGIAAIKLDPGDSLLDSFLVGSGDDVVVVSEKGQAIRFREKDVRLMGRQAGGVRGIRLALPAARSVDGPRPAKGEAPQMRGRGPVGRAAGDLVVGAGVCRRGSAGLLLVVSENGYGKKSKLSGYKVQRRGGVGIKTAKLTSKTGRLIDAKMIDSGEEEMVAISKQGRVLRTPLANIPILGRATQGVRLMRLRSGDRLASLTFL